MAASVVVAGAEFVVIVGSFGVLVATDVAEGVVGGGGAFLLDDGIRDPLLEVPMERTGRMVFVKVDGNLIDPSSGQGVLTEVYGLTRKYMMKREATLLTRMRGERDLRLRQAREVRTLRRPVEVSGSGAA